MLTADSPSLRWSDTTRPSSRTFTLGLFTDLTRFTIWLVKARSTNRELPGIFVRHARPLPVERNVERSRIVAAFHDSQHFVRGEIDDPNAIRGAGGRCSSRSPAAGMLS